MEKAKMLSRRRTAEVAFYDLHEIAARLNFESNPEAQYENKEKVASLDKAAGKSLSMQRKLKILKLHYIDGHPLWKLAEMFKIPEKEIGDYVKTAIVLFRAKLGVKDAPIK